MAHFIGTIDSSAARRAQFVEQAQRELASSHGSTAQAFAHADLAMVSWTQSWERLRHTTSARAASFIWGNAIEEGRNVATVPDLEQLWRGLPRQMPRPLEGLHVAVLQRSDGSWTVGADILGAMPVYYFCGADCVIVGSSPELFRAHPAFRATLDPRGLVGILLTNGLVSGRTLLQGVQRLGPGMLLHSDGAGAPRELFQYQPETSDRYAGASFDDNFERVHSALQSAFDRHLDKSKTYGLILSGGLDSRLVAATMKQHAVNLTAFSFGSARDIEMQCALQVATSLGLEHRTLPVRMERYREYAEDECKWRHLANGFSALMLYEPIPAEHLDGGMLSGYAMEAVIGGDFATRPGERPEDMCFARKLNKINRWGIPVGVVRRLVANTLGTAVVDEVIAQLESTYNGYADREFHKSWLFENYHRDRFHTSQVLGLHSRWAWPVVPYIDTKVLDLIGGMPYEHIKNRRMQHHMLKEQFPNLARIPLDRNTFNTKPTLPRYGRRVDTVLFKSRQLFYRWTRSIREPRFYYRVMDFNSSGWNAVRLAAEPHRSKVLQVLDEAVLAELLPRPGERFAVHDGITDTAKMKLLTGFLLWSARYL